ncbi:MAG: hypothetical protein LC792_14220, partial [Actinobacteria bacterium]|nr:hypothetical protein [Actinomycetota bacterium]
MFALAACSSSSSTGSAKDGSTTTTAPPSTSTPRRDIRETDWPNGAYPASVCGGSGTVQLLSSRGLVSSARWRDAWQGNDPPRMKSQVEVSFDGPVQYGDLDGDGKPEAVVPIWCTNGGGTAAGQLGQALVVYSGSPGRLELRGIISTTQPATDGATYFDNAASQIDRGRITVEELFYGPKDSTCCPTGRAQAVWALQGATLTRTS